MNSSSERPDKVAGDKGGAADKGGANDQAAVDVTCKLCGTRLNVSATLIGRRVKCPDCHSANLVTPKPIKVKPKSVLSADGDDYQLSPEEPSTRPVLNATDDGVQLADRLVETPAPRPAAPNPPRPATSALPVYCRVCNSLLYAHPDHVGKKVRCPDCDGLTVVQAARADTSEPFKLADVSDVVIERAPPPKIDEEQKERADRMMAAANAHTQAKRDERPKPPKFPLRDGVLAFAFYPSVMAIWIVFGVGLIVDMALIVVTNELLAGGGAASGLAVLLVPIVSLLTFGLLGIVTPHFLTMIEYTAEGYDRVPVWPSQDLLSRGRCIILWLNAIAMAAAPAGLVMLGLRKLGILVPSSLCLISLVFLLPPILLSMLLNDSVFLPYAKDVFTSLRTVRKDWIRVWIMTGAGIVALLAVRWGLARRIPEFADVCALMLFSCGTAVYCRIVGRIGWIISQYEEPDLFDDDEEIEDGSARPVTSRSDEMGEHEIFSGDDA